MAATFIGFSSPPVGKTVVLTDIELVKQDLYNCGTIKKESHGNLRESFS